MELKPIDKLIAFSLGAVAFACASGASAQDGLSNEAPPPQVVQDYEPDPAIWQLSDEDTTIYLFGTYHVLPDNFRWRSERFEQIVAEADELVVETSDADGEAQMGVVMGKMFAGIPDREPISNRLSPDAAEKWAKLNEMTGGPLALNDRLPLILTLLEFGVNQMEQLGSTSEHGVETWLEAEFERTGRPVGSIESGAEVLAALLAIDEAPMVAELERALNEWDGTSLETLVLDENNALERDNPFAEEHLWAQGTGGAAIDFGDSELDAVMKKVLLTDRNRAWAGWLDERLEQPGTVLLAVGAGHLAGDVSVQVMLEERGLAAIRVQ